jgi:alpha-glucosidase
VLGNHDRPRVASRLGQAQARVAAMLLLTLRGTPTLYYGDEIGMPQARLEPHEVRDPFERNVPGFGLGRDGCRTPMQWDDSRHAGFSDVAPWLPLGEDHRARNVVNERSAATSLYNLHRRLIALRRREPALSIGSWQPLATQGDLVIYIRAHGGARFLVALNLGHQPMHMDFGDEKLAGRVVLSTELDRDDSEIEHELALRGDEGVIVALR